jgi:hypothetical protein
LWIKTKGDELYFLGMEEGLHGNDLTGINLAGDETLQTNKFQTLGVRTGMYGSGYDLSYTKVGLEYRDVSRNLSTVFAQIERNAAEIENAVWDDPRVPSVREARDQGVFLLNRISWDPKRMPPPSGLSDSIYLRLLGAAPRLMIALHAFENEKFFSFQTKANSTPTPSQRERIVAARTHFLAELKKIHDEIQIGEAEGKTYESRDIALGIKQDLSVWAKEARISELYAAH